MQRYFPILQFANVLCCAKCTHGILIEVFDGNCFEEDTLFVEDSFAINSLNDCFDSCAATTCCEVFHFIDNLYVCRQKLIKNFVSFLPGVLSPQNVDSVVTNQTT